MTNAYHTDNVTGMETPPAAAAATAYRTIMAIITSDSLPGCVQGLGYFVQVTLTARIAILR